MANKILRKTIGDDKMVAPDTEKLLRLAFDHSLQANIIATVSNGKIIAANSAASKLLGYSKKELLTKSRATIFNINESSFKKMLRERSDVGQSSATVTAIKKSGKLLACEITSAIFKEDGIEKSITTIVDMSKSILKQKNINTKKEKIVADNIVLAKSKQKRINFKKDTEVAKNIKVAQAKSDARLAENNAWIKFIAKTSYDVMWDWDIATEEIYVGDSIEEVFGYKVQNNTVKFIKFTECLLPDEKDTVVNKLLETLATGKKSWNDSYKFKRHDHSIASTTSRASIVRDENGKAIRMIGAIQDISRLQELESKLEQKIIEPEKDSENLVPTLQYDALWDWNIVTNEVFIGEEFEKLFGYPIKKSKNNFADWANHLHAEDKEAVEKGLLDAIASTDMHWEHVYRFTHADGSLGKVFNSASIFRDADKKAHRIIGVIHDISRQKLNQRSALPLLDSKKEVLVEKIKNSVVEVVHYSDKQLPTNFSLYLSKKLDYDYTYLANLFSEVTGISILRYIISQKIERVKELIVEGKLNLTEIANKLHYSSVAHLSNQFKKATGLTPSSFKQQKHKQQTAL
ncbi:MAG: PAS domain-containing protein [Flavitalea sp.]